MRWRWWWCQKAEEEEEERGISSWEKGEKSLPLFTTVACAGREEDERRRKRGFWHQRAKPTRGKSLRDRCCNSGLSSAAAFVLVPAAVVRRIWSEDGEKGPIR